MAQRIHKGDKVKIISGDHKGTTATVQSVLVKKNAALLEGIGEKKRQMKPSRLNPMGGVKEVHTPVPLSKLALVTDAKTGKTSRVGYSKNADGAKVRLARQANNKEIK
jgi:large subunit ribosomal protein L24